MAEFFLAGGGRGTRLMWPSLIDSMTVRRDRALFAAGVSLRRVCGRVGVAQRVGLEQLADASNGATTSTSPGRSPRPLKDRWCSSDAPSPSRGPTPSHCDSSAAPSQSMPTAKAVSVMPTIARAKQEGSRTPSIVRSSPAVLVDAFSLVAIVISPVTGAGEVPKVVGPLCST
jgi:hypothetical protein